VANRDFWWMGNRVADTTAHAYDPLFDEKKMSTVARGLHNGLDHRNTLHTLAK